MRVLVCGHRSFVGTGILEALRGAGHDVVAFNRGPAGESDGVVTGPVDQLHLNSHLLPPLRPFDAVVNYILLKDEPVDRNVAFAESPLRFCRETGVRHLLHLSSISSYKANVAVVHEGA